MDIKVYEIQVHLKLKNYCTKANLKLLPGIVVIVRYLI